MAPLIGCIVTHVKDYYFPSSSGQEFSFDYLVGKRFGEAGQLRIGANGHYAYQVTKGDFGPGSLFVAQRINWIEERCLVGGIETEEDPHQAGKAEGQKDGQG